jgi:hypothetical protein
MASTTFIDQQTIIYAAWLNDANNAVYNGIFAASSISPANLVCNGSVSGTGFTNLVNNGLSAPGPIGNATPNTGAFTTLTLTNKLAVAQGGTGLATLTANNVILGNGTSTPTFVAPGTSGNVLTSNGTTWASTNGSGLAKAWVSFNASGTILKAYNVSSITVRGTGQWTINFATALADGNYVMAGNCAYGPTYVNSGGVLISFNWDGTNGTAPTASACEINTARLTYNGSDAVYFSPALTTVVFFD